MISHQFMTLTQLGDPPRHPPIMQDETYVEPDMPEFPMATTAIEEAAAHAPSDVDQPRHVVVTYIFMLILISFNLIMQYVNTLSVFVNVIGGLPSNCKKVGVVAQPKDSD